MTKEELIEAVKMESRVKSDIDLDALISDILTEKLREYSRLKQYQELLIVDHPIALSDSTGIYDLPSDYVSVGEIYFKTSYGYKWELVSRNSYMPRNLTGGNPSFYFIAGNKIYITPYEMIKGGDTLTLSYFSDGGTLFDQNTDPFPIPSLEQTVKLATINRILRYHNDLQGASMFLSDSRDSLFISKAQKDEGIN